MPHPTTTARPAAVRRRSGRLPALAVTLTLGLLLSGCAEDAEPTDATSPSASDTPSETTPTETATESPTEPATPEAQSIDITFSGDTVDPKGERVQAKVGEEIILRVSADAPGELHVHSTPEQQLSYKSGTSDVPLTIDQPGVIDVESHELDLVIVQLEVR